MNHLVFLNAQAGELERILSGVKTMLVKEFDPKQTATHSPHPGDSLYFLRDRDDCAVRVKAIVVRVLYFINRSDKVSQTLKEMQPKLQFTEDQYDYWSAKQRVVLVGFGSAHKISMFQIAPDKITEPSDWIAFEDFNLITGKA